MSFGKTYEEEKLSSEMILRFVQINENLKLLYKKFISKSDSSLTSKAELSKTDVFLWLRTFEKY